VSDHHEHLHEGSWLDTLKHITAWIGITFFFWYLFNHHESVKPIAAPRIMPASASNCSPFPASGASHIFEPAMMKRSDVLYSGLELQNDHIFPLVLVLTDPSGTTRYEAVSAAPNSTAKISVPVGQYGAHVLVGSTWCNLDAGFTDGVKISVTGGFSVQPGFTSTVKFVASGSRPEQFQASYITSRPRVTPESVQKAEVRGNGSLDLEQTVNGHYFSSGYVNGLPVVFLVDTGASMVSISSSVASRAGIQSCAPIKVSTANGDVQGCTATVSEISFGGFRIANVPVTILPNMYADGLLGMNVLRNFRIEQVGGKMRISNL
jgi:clan AA aspartic protease (TIGR02281 family)